MAQISTMPIGIAPEEWAARLRTDLSTDDIPQWTPDSTWQEWARRVCNQSSTVRGAAPFPEQFATFEEWATRVFEATN